MKSFPTPRRVLAAFLLLTALALPLAARPASQRVERAPRPEATLFTRVVSWLKDTVILGTDSRSICDPNGGCESGPFTDGRGGWDPNG
jgi:hypothetical protein